MELFDSIFEAMFSRDTRLETNFLNFFFILEFSKAVTELCFRDKSTTSADRDLFWLLASLRLATSTGAMS